MFFNFIINLLNNQTIYKTGDKNFLRKFAKTSKFLFYFILFLLTVSITFSFNIIFSKDILSDNESQFFSWEQLKRVIIKQKEGLKGEKEDRINILLLGIGGEGHDGSYLADTIILASLKPRAKKVSLISIPRDLYVSIPSYGQQKINHALALGEIKNPGKGEALICQVVSEIFNIPIHYYIRVDFESFKKIIDIVGGIDIYVENTINDYYYPIRGKEDAKQYQDRFEHLYIKKGARHMDGALALKYTRSRHSVGSEGNDFSRAKRQQNVLLALRKKILSLEFLIQPHKIIKVLDILKKHIRTNLETREIIQLSKLLKEINSKQIINKVLDSGPDGPLYADTVNGAYILRPKAGDFSELSRIVQNIFEE